MKTTIDIPDDMLNELLENTRSRTKKEAVLTAIKTYNQQARMAELTSILGIFVDFMDHDELDTMRRDM